MNIGSGRRSLLLASAALSSLFGIPDAEAAQPAFTLSPGFFSPANYGLITDGGIFGDGLSHPASSNGFSTLAGLQATYQAASFTATGSGTALTVTSVTGVLYPSLTLGIVSGISAGTTIVRQTSGTPGGAGVYVTSSATTISGAAATASWASDPTNDMAGLMTQAAIHACHVAGGGKIPLAPGKYYNLPTGLSMPANTCAQLVGISPSGGNGVGSAATGTVILCSTVPTAVPWVTIGTQGDHEGPLRNLTFWGFDVFTFGTAPSAGGVAATNTFLAGSIGILFYANSNVVYEGLNFVNCDQPFAWDTVVGGNHTITFRSGSCRYGNAGASVNYVAPNSFEKMMWEDYVFSGNNYGAYIIAQTTNTPGTGSTKACDFYFHNCSLDYNIVNMIYYLGAAYTGASENSVYLEACHLETGSAVSGTTARILHDGRLVIQGGDCFEFGPSLTVGLVTPLAAKSITYLSAVRGGTNNGTDATSIPLIYSPSIVGRFSGGHGNSAWVDTNTVLYSDSNGSVSGFDSVSETNWTISGAFTIALYQTACPTALMVTGNAAITLAPDSTTNVRIGKSVWFVATPGHTGTFTPGAGVTINGPLSFGGVNGGFAYATKTAANTWNIVSGGTSTGTATATAGAATLNTSSGIVTSEALVAATTYTLTLTNSAVLSTSQTVVTPILSTGAAVNITSITEAAGTLTIVVNMAAFTGTIIFRYRVSN